MKRLTAIQPTEANPTMGQKQINNARILQRDLSY